MAEEEAIETIRPQLLTSRIKKIMKLDRDINKVNSEALFLVTCSTELFLRFLAKRSAEVAKEKKRRIVKLKHIRTAVKKYQPTGDFLFDSLAVPSEPSDRPATERSRSKSVAYQPAPAGTRRIDDIFHKQVNKPQPQIDES